MFPLFSRGQRPLLIIIIQGLRYQYLLIPPSQNNVLWFSTEEKEKMEACTPTHKGICMEVAHYSHYFIGHCKSHAHA